MCEQLAESCYLKRSGRNSNLRPLGCRSDVLTTTSHSLISVTAILIHGINLIIITIFIIIRLNHCQCKTSKSKAIRNCRHANVTHPAVYVESDFSACFRRWLLELGPQTLQLVTLSVTSTTITRLDINSSTYPHKLGLKPNESVLHQTSPMLLDR